MRLNVVRSSKFYTYIRMLHELFNNLDQIDSRLSKKKLNRISIINNKMLSKKNDV